MKQIKFFDTTLRDGDQAPGYAMTMYEKKEIAQGLVRMNVDIIEAGFPISSELDFKASKQIATKIKGRKIAALARAVPLDIDCAADALRECEQPRIHTFIATSEEHMRDKLRKTPHQVLDAIKTSVSLASEYMEGRGDVQWSAEDASRSSMDFLIKAVKTAIDAGATTINLPDTVGYAQPAEYENMFREVIAAVAPESEAADDEEPIVFSAHTHDDLGLAVANSLAALKGGATQIECSVRGVGERAGNAQIEAIVACINVRGDLYPFSHQIDTRWMKSTADLHASFFPDAPSLLPVVGDNACAHGSGVHQQGMLITARHKELGCYGIIIPEDYGHEGTTYPLTRHSGLAGMKAALERQGKYLPDVWGPDFARYFKQCAGEILEKERVRVVSPERVANWADKWAANRGMRLPTGIRADTLGG